MFSLSKEALSLLHYAFLTSSLFDLSIEVRARGQPLVPSNVVFICVGNLHTRRILAPDLLPNLWITLTPNYLYMNYPNLDMELRILHTDECAIDMT